MVSQFKIFAGLPEEEIEELTEMFKIAAFDKKRRVEFADFSNDYIYMVKTGQLKVSYASPDGKEIIVALLNPGDIYSMHSEAIGVALEPTELMYIEAEKFKDIIIGSPLIAVNMVRILGNILKDTNDVLLNVAFKEVNSRLAALIMKISRQHGIVTEEGLLVQIDLTHEEIANLINSTRQTVTTILNRFEKAGMIESRRKRILIKEVKKLEELAL